jgi:hypothetical protein
MKALLILLLLVGSANAADLFVDKDNGCPGSGTTGSPYCSIQNAFNAVAAGDTIKIRDAASSYDEGAVLTTTGTVGNPITIQPDTGHNPTITKTGGTAAIEIRRVSYVTLQNLNFNGTGVNTGTYAVLVRSATTCDNGFMMQGIQILNNTFQNWGGNESEASTAGTRAALSIDGGFCIPQQANMADGVIVTGNLFSANRQISLLVLHAKNTRIEDNEVTGQLCGRDSDTAVNALGIKIIDSTTVGTGNGNIVRGNTIRDFQEHVNCGIVNQAHATWAGVWCDAHPDSGLVEKNTIYNIDQNKGNNSNSNGLSHASMGIFIEYGCDDWVVKNNLVYDVGYIGIRLGSEGAGIAARPLIYNNTLYSIAAYSLYMARADDADVRNNIIHDSGTAAIVMSADTVTHAGHTINQNLYFDTAGGNKVGSYNGGGVTNFATWKTNCGCDASSLNNDPLFSTPLFTLQAGSPAKDAGATIASVTDDLNSIARTEPYSIGAFEFTTALNPAARLRGTVVQ